MSDKSFKVEVWSGSGHVYLGRGTYVGEATVYAIAMEDGSIKSLGNAEERPSDELIKETGGRLVELPDNPKIVLDDIVIDEENGTETHPVVYGCQVWWHRVKSNAEEVSKNSR